MGEPAEQIELIDKASCKRLLGSTHFGRLAVVVDALPHIVVLNHAMLGGDLMFRTTDDATLVELTANGPVPAVYEVDSAFPVGRSGWSVIASGRLSQETDTQRADLARSQVEAWAHGERDVVLRLSIDEVSGRRVGPL